MGCQAGLDQSGEEVKEGGFTYFLPIIKGDTMRKTLKEFIKENRQEIDEATKSPYKNDHERRLWILNDEGLYNWARSEGVRI